MPFCRNDTYTIDFERDFDGEILDRLFFDLTVEEGQIRGHVFLSTGDPLSEVTGSCTSLAELDVSVVEMNFRWETTTVFVVGIIYFLNSGSGRIKFIGRFRAVGGIKERTVRGRVSAPPLPPIPPADGDTGTGSGTQT